MSVGSSWPGVANGPGFSTFQKACARAGQTLPDEFAGRAIQDGLGMVAINAIIEQAWLRGLVDVAWLEDRADAAISWSSEAQRQAFMRWVAFKPKIPKPS